MKARLVFWHYLLFFILLIALIFAGFETQRTVRAQTETVLAVTPEVTSLYLNGDLNAQVQVTISNVESLTGFDITLTYDGSIMAVSSWSHGGFLSNLFCVNQINDPGYFSLACTQIAQPGVSGSGSLIDLNITGLSEGTTDLHLERYKLADSSIPPNPIPAILQDGTIHVGYATNVVMAEIFMQGQANRANIPVSLGIGLTYGQGPFDAASSAVLGNNLIFPNLVNNDSYLFTTAMPHYLNIDAAQGKTVTVSGSDLGSSPLELLAGDADQDNAITTADLDAIRDLFDAAGDGLSPDVNFDGLVNIQDLALAGGNLGLTGADAYSGWQP